ncbi:Zn-dependent protease, partial [candidate division GN15 bacterium]
MRMDIILWLTLAAACACAGEVNIVRPSRLAHTYSIVAYDSATGQFGAAVQSHYFRVADVIWAEAGIGAVATQSLVDFAYGPLGLDMMRNGKTATQALAGLLASDPSNSVRQVAMIDRYGNVAAHTGAKCIPEAGNRTGKNYSVQANLMLKNTVWDAMAKAFESAQGDLADRMMAALEAAQGEGGDIRGMQSAAILVVTGKPTGQVWRDRLVDLRVDDSPKPLDELKRLLTIQRAYKHEDKGDDYTAIGKTAEAEVEYEEASRLAP